MRRGLWVVDICCLSEFLPAKRCDCRYLLTYALGEYFTAIWQVNSLFYFGM